MTDLVWVFPDATLSCYSLHCEPKCRLRVSLLSYSSRFLLSFTGANASSIRRVERAGAVIWRLVAAEVKIVGRRWLSKLVVRLNVHCQIDRKMCSSFEFWSITLSTFRVPNWSLRNQCSRNPITSAWVQAPHTPLQIPPALQLPPLLSMALARADNRPSGHGEDT